MKLIVLDRLATLKTNPAHEKILQVSLHISYICIHLTEALYTPSWLHLQDLVMDLMRVLSAPDVEVRKKTLGLALELITSKTVEEVPLP